MKVQLVSHSSFSLQQTENDSKPKESDSKPKESDPKPKESDSKPKTLQDIVAYCAKVSNPANQLNTETNEKLIRYLIKNNHWSPLEMVSICLEVETTRDIARQILRHRSFSFQEFSQRYAVASLGFENKEARLQDTKNRQNSIYVENPELQDEWTKKQEEISAIVDDVYRWALSKGIAKEQARAVLPEGMTVSRMYMNGTLRSWVHYIMLRSGNGTQKEHKDVALACAKAIEPIFPMIMEFISAE
jgi:thymidylate synthase (FAD)